MRLHVTSLVSNAAVTTGGNFGMSPALTTKPRTTKTKTI